MLCIKKGKMLFMYNDFFKKELEVLKNEGRYRVFTDLERLVEQSPIANWYSPDGLKEVVVWCSNDYLGMSHNPQVIAAANCATKTYGVGSGGTRNISGTGHLHVELENKVAKLHQKEAGLIFTSGYVANEATLSTLGQSMPNMVLFCDEKNHASMIQGARHSKANRHIFSHNNLEELHNQLAAYDKNTPKIIAFVSLYSMDGDFAPIKEICDLADEYKALTYLDEVHAVGIYGEGGSGFANQLKQQNRIDIIQGNFAKAYGVIGGYIAGSRYLIDYIRSFASGFIFTTSLPPMVTASIIESISFLEKADYLRETLQKRVSFLKKLLKKTSINYRDTPSHIVPVIIGDAKKCREFTDILLNNYGIYVQPINYPTVTKGQERIRITVTPMHTEDMITHLVESLCTIWNSFDFKLAA